MTTINDHVAALDAHDPLRGFRDEVDPENAGGAYLLGLRSLGVVPHGRFTRRGFSRAILLAARGVDVGQHRTAMLPFRRAHLVAPAIGWTTRRIPIARRSLEAHTDPHTSEALAVIEDTMQEARRLGIRTPRLER